MQALSQESLARNAFRVLGLSAGAGQAQIDSAARRMRLWATPAQIPPTPWDLPWLGPLPRSRSDIEFAVACLVDPVSRINQRLFWFSERGPALTPQPRGRIFRRDLKPLSCASPAGDPCCVAHDAALARLAWALTADPDFQFPQKFGGALADFCRSAGSLDYRNWSVAAEGAGQFEKKAGVDEALTLMAGLPGSIAELLATRARDALDHDRPDTCTQLVDLLRTVGPDQRLQHKLETGICDRIEDLLSARCKKLQNDLFRNIDWKGGRSPRAVRANRATCRRAAREVNKSIDPLFAALSYFEAVAPTTSIISDRMKRLAQPASGMLRNLGLGWGRVGQRQKAAHVFRRALRLTNDREMTAKLNADLADLKLSKPKRPGRVVLIVIAVAVVRGFATLISGSSPPSTDAAKTPNYRELLHEQEMRDRALHPWVPPMLDSPQIDPTYDSFLHPRAIPPAVDDGSLSRPATPRFDELFPEMGQAGRWPSTEPSSTDRYTQP